MSLRSLRGALLIAGLIAGVGLAVWQLRGASTVARTSPSVSGLIRALGADRPFETRIVGGVPHTPLRQVTRGKRAESNLALLAAAGELQLAIRTNPDRADLHAWGVAQLLVGEAGDAITTLENYFSDREPTPAEEANLGAAYGARAATDADPGDWFRALARSDRAVRRDPRLSEAWFNRALALEALALHGEAHDGWQAFLDHETDSAWAAEGRAHLEQLAARREMPAEGLDAASRRALLDAGRRADINRIDTLIAVDPQGVRRLLEYDWLADLPREREAIDGLIAIANRFSLFTHDDFARDLYASLARAPAERSAMLSAFVEMTRASESSDFGRVRQIAVPHGSGTPPPESLWIDYYRLQAQAQQGDLAPIVDELVKLERMASASRFLHLEGTVANRIGQLQGRMGRQQDAIASRDRAIAVLTKCYSLDLVATMEALIAESYRYSGDTERALLHHRRSLNLSEGFRTYRTRHQVYVQAGVSASALGLDETAARFFAEARRNAEVWSSFPSAAAITSLRLASALSAMGADREAQQMVDEAETLINQIPDSGFRERNTLELLEVRGRLRPSAAAIAEIDRAIDKFAEAGNAVRLPQLQLLKARQLTLSGDPQSAIAAVDRGVAQLGVDRRSILDASLRRSQSEMFVSLETEAARAYLVSGEHVAALARVDAAKALSTEEGFADSGDQPSRQDLVPGLQRLLQPDVAVLVLADLGQHTEGWLIDAGGVQHSQLLRTDHLRTSVRRLRAAILDRDDVKARQLGAYLGNQIVTPFADRLTKVAKLSVVPSASVAGLPFAALRIDRDTRYLVEAVELSSEPSLELLRRHTTRPSPSGPPRQALTVVAGERRGPLPSLPNAAGEATRVSGLYSDGRVLKGSEPFDVLRDAARAADVFHFVGHAVVTSGGASLVVGANASTDWDAARIRSLGRTSLRTVVLASCSSAYIDGVSGTVDALLSTAAPFLAIGVPEVVGTLWPIEDDDAARLSFEIHRELSAGRAAGAAVAATQRRAIAAGETASMWSSLQAIGPPSVSNPSGALR